MTKEEKYNLIEAFYNKERKTLLKRLAYRAGTPEGAEDVLQTSFANALQYCDSFDPTHKDIGAWFNTIMNNALRLYQRDERNCGAALELDEELIETEPMSETNPDTVKRIQAEIAKCDVPTRDILHLHFNLEYKPREISAVLDVKPKVATDAIYSFKKQMQEKFGGK